MRFHAENTTESSDRLLKTILTSKFFPTELASPGKILKLDDVLSDHENNEALFRYSK